jgi:hypothetical protein
LTAIEINRDKRGGTKMKKSIYLDVAKKHPEKIMPPFDEVYSRLGFEGLSVVIDIFGGCQTYVPYYKAVLSNCVKHAVGQEYNGKNVRQLCRKYGISERTLFRYLDTNTARIEN